MFHFVHPASYGHHQLPSRAQSFYGHRRPASYQPNSGFGAGFGTDLATLTAENDRLEARIAALEERARYEDALEREYKRREAAAKRLAQLEARQRQNVLPSAPVRALNAPQAPVNCRQVCQQGPAAPALARRAACRRRSVPQSTEVVDDVVNLLNAIFGGQEQPQRQVPAPKPTKPTTEAKEDPFHLAELLQRREEFLSLFTDKPVKRESNQAASPVASGSNVKLSDTLQDDAVPAATLHARSRASAVLSSLSNQFLSLKSSFIIPSAPPAGFEFKKVNSDSSSPALAFNPVNAPISEFEQQLTKLLSKADEIDSAGSAAVRDQRKALVKQVGEELEKLEQWKAEVWASQSSPVQRPAELEEVQGKGKGKARPVSIEVDDDDDDRSTVRILAPLTSAPNSPSSLAHHSELFSEAPVLDQIYPSPPSFANTDNEEVVGYDVSFDAPAAAPIVAEPTSVVHDAVAEEAHDTTSVDLPPVAEPTSDSLSETTPVLEAQPAQPAFVDDVAPALVGTTDPFADEVTNVEVDDAASSSSSDYGDTADSVLLTTAKDGSILVTETEEAAASSGDEYEVL